MTSQNVKKNTVYSIIKSCAAVIFPLITFPYISRVLQANNVGKVNFSNSIISYFSLIASLGVTTYAIRECAKVKSDKEKLGQVASEIISINICTTVISYILLLILMIFAKPLQGYKYLIIIQSTNILFTTLGADWLNTAMEDFRYITIRTVAFQVIAIVLMFSMVRKPSDYMIYAVIMVIATSGGNIANIFYRKRYCKTQFTFNMNVKKHMPPILKLFAMLLSQQIFCNSDTTMLGLMHGDYEVGLYGTAVKVYNVVNSLMASITWVVMPKLSCAFAEEDYNSVNNTLEYALNFIITLGAPCVIAMNLLASDIILIVGGKGYLEATMALRILAVTLAISLIWGFFMNIILLPSGKDGVCLRACIAGAVFNVIVNAILIPRFSIEGAAIATACSQLIGLIFCIPYIDKRVKVNFKRIIKPPIFGSIVLIIVLIVIRKIVNVMWLRFIFSAGLGSVVYMLVQLLLKNELIVPIWKKIVKG